MKCCIYARVSTLEQSTDNQLGALTAWAKYRGHEVVAVYQEAESGWKSGHQKELKRLIDDGRKGKFNLVLVWSLDRLTREGPAAILGIINTLKQYRCRVHSYQEAWTESPGELGELLYSIAGWVAKMESERRSERTKAGLQRAVKAGKKLGRPIGRKDKKKRKKRTDRSYA